MAQEARSGTFKTVQGGVKVVQGDAQRAVIPGAGVQEAERVQTDASGSAVLMLRDGTSIAIGPNTTVDISRFQFDGTTQQGSLAVRVLQGTIRMVTGLLGKVQPDNVKVTTPATQPSVCAARISLWRCYERALPRCCCIARPASVCPCKPCHFVAGQCGSVYGSPGEQCRRCSGSDPAPIKPQRWQQDGRLEAGVLSAEEVQEKYKGLLSLPMPTASQLTLRFEPGTSNLTAESQGQLPEIIALASKRAGGEILVVGHTDRTGSPQANDTLSLQRAQAVRELLVQRGFAPERIEAIGRGEREPVVHDRSQRE